jgi:hypothetical protein
MSLTLLDFGSSSLNFLGGTMGLFGGTGGGVPRTTDPTFLVAPAAAATAAAPAAAAGVAVATVVRLLTGESLGLVECNWKHNNSIFSPSYC